MPAEFVNEENIIWQLYFKDKGVLESLGIYGKAGLLTGQKKKLRQSQSYSPGSASRLSLPRAESGTGEIVQ